MRVTTEINEYVEHPNKDEPKVSDDVKKLRVNRPEERSSSQ